MDSKFTTPSKYEKFLDDSVISDKHLDWSAISNETYVPLFGPSSPSLFNESHDETDTKSISQGKSNTGSREFLLEEEVRTLREELKQALIEKAALASRLEAQALSRSAGLAIEAPPAAEESTSTCCNSNLDTPFFSPVVDKWQVSSVADEAKSGSGTVLQLMDACRRGDVHSIDVILSAQHRLVNMREADCHGQSPVHAACSARSKGDPAVLRLLVERYGADVHCTDDNGSSALHYACANGFVAMIRQLVRDYGVSVEVQDLEGKTPLFYAAYNGRLAAAVALVQEFRADVRYRNPSDWTALHCAARNGHASVASFLAEDCDMDTRNYVGKTALHYAAEHGHAEVLAVLVRSGCCVTVTDVTDSTALHYACHRGDAAAAEVLLAGGQGRIEIEMEMEGDLATQCRAANRFGMTALLYACCPPHHQHHLQHHESRAGAGGGGPVIGLGLLRTVLGAGASDIDAANHDGFTALMLACIGGSAAGVALLLEHGASLSPRDRDGYDAFQHAFFNGRAAVLCVLTGRLAQDWVRSSRSWLFVSFFVAAVLTATVALTWSSV